MASAKDPDNNAVFTGFWIDWHRGKVFGATLTLRDRDAVPLVAALVILVTLAGGRSWHLCRLLWHSQLRSKAESPSQSAREHRRIQQVLLRNSETAPGATISLIQEWWAFGTTRVLRDCTPKDVLLALFTLGHWVVFIVLGVLVSQIVVGKVVVSKTLDTCGQWMPKLPANTDIPSEEATNIFNELQLNKTINSDNYVRTCYPQGGSEGRVDCNKLLVQSIPYKITHNETCPFNATVCSPNAKSAVTLTSVNVTLAELGINTKYGTSISVERSSNCAVMDINFFRTTNFKEEDGSSGTRGYTFYKEAKTNKTSELVFSLRNQFSEDYKLMSFWFGFLTNEELMPALRATTMTEYEITIMLLQGLGIEFLKPTDDPWFAANQEVKYNNPVPEGWRRYSMDAFVNMIACTERYRFCSEITNQCSPYQRLLNTLSAEEMVSAYKLLFGPDGLKPNSSESWDLDKSITLIEQIMRQTALTWSIQQRGQAALQASRFLSDGLQVRLKPEQWKAELEYWFMMALARLQLEILNTIEKPPNLDASNAYNSWQTTESAILANLCGRIKFRSPNHTSLSTFGLAMILAFSGLLLLSSSILSSLFWMPWMQRWKIVEEWQRDDVLTLLKRMNEMDHVQGGTDTDVERSSIVMGEKKTKGGDDNNQLDPFLVRH